MSFDVLYGVLPPGIVLGPAGLINGVLEDIGSVEPKTYQVTIRVSNGSRIADRSFSIVAEPIIREAYWISNSLPSEQEDTGFSYYNFGILRLGEDYARTLDVSDDDLGVPEVVGKPLGFDGNFFKGLPSGLTLIDNRIQGVVDKNSLPGRYLFRLGFEDQFTNEIVGEIIVTNELSPEEELQTLFWLTPEGHLGSLHETRICDLSVKVNAPDAFYFLTPASLPLPPGIQINPGTGDLEGFAPPVVRDTVYRFSVRASKGGQHIDREFSITILNRYAGSVHDVRLRVPQIDQVDMIARYIDLISPNDVFRPRDPRFGIVKDPYIYVIKGVAGVFVNALLPPNDSVDGQGYHGTMTFYLGEHRSAVVRNDVGEIIYEVVYRHIVDPNALAGGFKFDENTPIENKILYPQSKPNSPRYIYPRSLRNARYDFVNKLGMPTTNISLSRRLGIDGGEILPSWMMAQQTKNDPKSALGFVPAVVVAYVVPNKGQEYAFLFNRDRFLPPIGKQISTDRYYIHEERRSAPTTFDDDSTNFDGNGLTIIRATFDG